MAYDAETARSVVAMLQAAVDEAIGTRNPEPLVGCFAEGAVMAGTTRYNAGDDAVRDYLSLVATANNALRWHLGHHDVFLATDDVIGFGAEGEVEWADDEDSGRDPFRLTVVARDTPEGWRVLHFHGSVPAS
jgi:hypothetical protein